MTRVNAYNSAGLQNFVVDQDPANGNFTTIQDAVDAASSVGAGNIWINHGFYTENVAITNGNFGIFGDNVSNSFQVVISGNLTITNHTGNISFQNISFQAPAGDTITINSNNASSGQIQFTDCQIQSSAGIALNIIEVAPASFQNQLNGCSIQGETGAISVNGTGGLQCQYCAVNANGGSCFDLAGGVFCLSAYCLVNSAGHAVTIEDGSSSIVFTDMFGSEGLEYINFVGPGSATVVNCAMQCAAPSGFWVTGTGLLIYSNATVLGSINIDPTTTQVTPGTLPYATADVSTPPAVKGSCAFNSADFTVVNGFVSAVAPPPSFVWSSISADQSLVAGNGYFVSGGALNLALPASATIGDTISVALAPGGTSWTITQGAGQSIVVGNLTSTVGAGGSVASTAAGDVVTIVFFGTDTWQATEEVGSLSVT